MAKYRKRPIEVDAHQWDGDYRSMVEFLQYEDEHQRLVLVDCTDIGGVLSFFCLKSNRFVELQPEGWVIAEPDGFGFYPCTAEQFTATYEEVQ